MSITRRLLDLENRKQLQPFRRPINSKRTTPWPPGMESIWRKLCCPLPAGHSPEELHTIVDLFKTAQKMQRDDQTGWMAVRKYALMLHRRYGGEFADASDEYEPLN